MIRDAASQRQVDAASPHSSTWLSANAGSGKTRVLTDRVARLLLEGVSPQNILCLTYTKAAAAEMQNRLFKRLGAWAMMADGDLRRDLKDLGAIKTSSGYELPNPGKDGERELAAVANLIRLSKPAGPNLLVIKTATGAAQRVALALDRSNWPEIIGNLGGDDTVFVATASATGQKQLVAKIDRAVSR